MMPDIRSALSVEQPFPAQRDAGLSAYQYLVAQEHVKPERIVIAGDSAGGKKPNTECSMIDRW